MENRENKEMDQKSTFHEQSEGIQRDAHNTNRTITFERVTALTDTKYVKVYDLEYDGGKHYYDVSRRETDNLTALKSAEEYHDMLPDGIGCCIVVYEADKEPKLLLTREYRYPIGRFILGPISGIIDDSDKRSDDPYVSAAKREILEETGLHVGYNEEDRIFTVNQCLFCSPGLTDDCCAVVCAVIHVDDLSHLTSENANETEFFEGYELLTKAEVMEILKGGRDRADDYYSVFAWVTMTCFALELWK